MRHWCALIFYISIISMLSTSRVNARVTKIVIDKVESPTFEGQDFGPVGKYGKWILQHNVVIKIDGTLFLHGGIAPRYADLSVRQINERVREELGGAANLQGGIVTDEH